LYGRPIKRTICMDDAFVWTTPFCMDDRLSGRFVWTTHFVWTTDLYGRRTIQHGTVIIRSSINITYQVSPADYHSISSTVITARSTTNPLRFLALKPKNQCSCALGPCRISICIDHIPLAHARPMFPVPVTFALGCLKAASLAVFALMHDDENRENQFSGPGPGRTIAAKVPRVMVEV
jgi:hypothetical protein